MEKEKIRICIELAKAGLLMLLFFGGLFVLCEGRGPIADPVRAVEQALQREAMKSQAEIEAEFAATLLREQAEEYATRVREIEAGLVRE